MSFLDKYVQMSSAEFKTKLKLVQLGKPGAGKTTRALKATRWGNVLVWDFDDKVDAIKKALTPEQQGKVFVKSFRLKFEEESGNMETEAITEFIKELEGLEQMVAKGEDPGFSTIVFDTWTTYELFYIPFLLAQNTEIAVSKGSKSVTRNSIDTGAGIIEVANLQDYGALRKAQERMVRRLTNLPFNLIINFHESTTEDKITKQEIATLLTTGSIRDSLPAFVNEVHRLSSPDGKKYVARIRPSHKWPALKTALPKDAADEIQSDDLSVFDDIAYKTKGEK